LESSSEIARLKRAFIQAAGSANSPVRKKRMHSLLKNWMGSYLKHNFKV